MGNLIKKTDGATTTTYVQDLNGGLPQILIEDDGATVAKYTYGADRLKVSRSGEYYYFYDGLGSTRTITNTSGTVICRYVYDVYGKPLASETNETQTWNVFKFTGEYYDDDIELVYLRARWYDPSTGRFMTRDTQAARDYKYCYNDPVNATDPTGHIPINALGAVYAIGMAMKVMGIVFNIKNHFDADIANHMMLYEWFFEFSPKQNTFVVDTTRTSKFDARIWELSDSWGVEYYKNQALIEYYNQGGTKYEHTYHWGTLNAFVDTFFVEGYKSTIFWMGGYDITITIDESENKIVYHIKDTKDWNSASLPPLIVHPVETIPYTNGKVAELYSLIDPDTRAISNAIGEEVRNNVGDEIRRSWICKNFWQRKRGQTGGLLGLLVNHGGTMYMEYIWEEPLNEDMP